MTLLIAEGKEEDAKAFLNYLDSKKLSDKTIQLYLEYYLKMPVHEFKREFNNKEVFEFLNKNNNNSVVRAFIKNYFEYRGINHIHIPTKTGRRKSRILRLLSEAEKKTLLIRLYNYKFKFGLCYELTYYGALRSAELLNIHINDFLWREWKAESKEPCKLIVRGKGDRERFIFIPFPTMVRVAKYIKSLPDAEVDTKLFTFHYKFWHRTLSFLSKKYLGRKVNPHLIRHTRATDLSNAGVSIQIIKEFLGHSSITTTEIYIKPDRERILESLKKHYFEI